MSLSPACHSPPSGFFMGRPVTGSVSELDPASTGSRDPNTRLSRTRPADYHVQLHPVNPSSIKSPCHGYFPSVNVPDTGTVLSDHPWGTSQDLVWDGRPGVDPTGPGIQLVGKGVRESSVTGAPSGTSTAGVGGRPVETGFRCRSWTKGAGSDDGLSSGAFASQGTEISGTNRG